MKTMFCARRKNEFRRDACRFLLFCLQKDTIMIFTESEWAWKCKTDLKIARKRMLDELASLFNR